MKIKIIFWALVLVWLLGTTFAFFGGKSCEDWNSTKCFKEINQIKKDYSKKELKAFRLQEFIDKLEADKAEIQAKIDNTQKDLDFVNGELRKFKEEADWKRSALQKMGF